MYWRVSERRWRALFILVGWLMAGAVCWLSLTGSPPTGPDLPNVDKIAHLVGYFTLSAWFGQLYFSHRGRLLHAAFLISMGITLEWLQGVSGLRTSETADAIANTLGVLAGLTFSLTPARCILLRVVRRVRGAGDAVNPR